MANIAIISENTNGLYLYTKTSNAKERRQTVQGDFDCKDLTEDEFVEMTDEVLTFLHRSGINVEARDNVPDAKSI